MQFRFVDTVPTHFTIATFPKKVLTVLALLFCPAVCSLDMTHTRTFTGLSTWRATNKIFYISYGDSNFTIR